MKEEHVRLLDRLGLVKGIRLVGIFDEQYFTWVKRYKGAYFWYAHVYPQSKVGHVFLLQNGWCFGKSSYIKYWYWLRPRHYNGRLMKNILKRIN